MAELEAQNPSIRVCASAQKLPLRGFARGVVQKKLEVEVMVPLFQMQLVKT